MAIRLTSCPDSPSDTLDVVWIHNKTREHTFIGHIGHDLEEIIWDSGISNRIRTIVHRELFYCELPTDQLV